MECIKAALRRALNKNETSYLIIVEDRNESDRVWEYLKNFKTSRLVYKVSEVHRSFIFYNRSEIKIMHRDRTPCGTVGSRYDGIVFDNKFMPISHVGEQIRILEHYIYK